MFISIFKIVWIVSWKSYQRKVLFIEVACILVFMECYNLLQLREREKKSYTFINIDFVKYLKVGLSRRKSDRVNIIKLFLSHRSLIFQAVYHYLFLRSYYYKISIPRLEYVCSLPKNLSPLFHNIGVCAYDKNSFFFWY